LDIVVPIIYAMEENQMETYVIMVKNVWQVIVILVTQTINNHQNNKIKTII
jgi:hypothetical protein